MKLTELIIPTDSEILTKGIRSSLTLFLFLDDRSDISFYYQLTYYFLTLGRTRQFIPPPWYKREGVDGTPPRSFRYFAVFRNDFASSGKPLLFLTRWGIAVLALLETCDVINNGRYFGRHLGFYQELEIRLKPREMVVFLCFTWKITHKKALCMIIATRFTFIVERGWKNMYFHPKLAWPPATYDVVSRNHSNWLSLNLSQNVRKGWMNSYWKRQVMMFYFLRKNSEKPYGRWMPPLYVPGLRRNWKGQKLCFDNPNLSVSSHWGRAQIITHNHI